MDLAPYVASLRAQLVVAAGGTDEQRDVAERLVASLEATTRLVLLEALSSAAAEITLDLAPTSVEVRLRGRDPELVVTGAPEHTSPDASAPAPQGVPAAPVPAAAPAPDDADSTLSRTTFRLPEHLKRRMEDAAERQGLSVNAWLIRAVTDAVQAEEAPRRQTPTLTPQTRFTGWAR